MKVFELIRICYTTLTDILQDIFHAFRISENNHISSDFIILPSNDNDIQGIYEYLIWSATKSGWASDKLHYIEILFKKAVKN